MSKFNVGDKVYLECEVIRKDMRDNTYRLKYKNCYGCGDKDSETDYVKDDVLHSADDYNKGLNDAWELAKKIVLYTGDGGYTWQELTRIFGEGDCGDVLKAFTPQEALAKAKAYEDERNEIRVGDVVKLKGTSHEAIVTRVSVTSLCFLFKDGSCASLSAKEDFEKTDKHFDSIDEFMKS